MSPALSASLSLPPVAPAIERLAPLSIDVLDARDYRRTEADLLEQFAFRYGCSYDAYLATEPGRELFWSRDRSGVVALVRVGRYLKIGGGLLAADEQKPKLLRELIDYANQRRLVLTFYNIPEDDLPLFRRHGCQVTKWGAEALVDLPGQTWGGKAFEWVRRQTNFCRRQRMVCSEYLRFALSAHECQRITAEMAEIAGQSPDDKPQSAEIRFLQGSFDPRHLGRKRIFLAQSPADGGRIEGFLIANPAANGQRWVFEVYRHRPDAVRGTIAFLMHEAMQILAREGVEEVSLCLVPGLDCAQPLPGDSRLVRFGMTLGTRYFNFLFDAAGLYHFKSRFRPRFESRYVCAYPRVTLGSAMTFIWLVNVLNLDWRKVVRLTLGRLRKLTARATLAPRS